MLIDDPIFYLVAVPAILVYGIGKGGLGGAVGDVVVPFMALAISPSLAASILMPILIVMDIFALRHHRRNVDWQQIKDNAAGRGCRSGHCGPVPETAAGVRAANPDRGYFGGLCHALRLQAQRDRTPMRPLWRQHVWCGLGGFTSTAIHAGGGPVSIYLLPQKLDKLKLIGTIVWFFAIINFLKLGAYTYLGGMSIDNLITAAVLMPLAPIGVRIGVYLLHRVSQDLIYRLCYLFLFISGFKLLLDGINQAMGGY